MVCRSSCRQGLFPILTNPFTNDKASIHVDGTKFLANPGTGDKTWNSDLADAQPETVKLILRQIFKTRPFLTEANLAHEREMERWDKVQRFSCDLP